MGLCVTQLNEDYYYYYYYYYYFLSSDCPAAMRPPAYLAFLGRTLTLPKPRILMSRRRVPHSEMHCGIRILMSRRRVAHSEMHF